MQRTKNEEVMMPQSGRAFDELSMSFSCAPLLSVACSLVFPYFRQRIHQLCFQADKTVITALQTFTRFNRRPLCARRSVHECSFNELHWTLFNTRWFNSVFTQCCGCLMSLWRLTFTLLLASSSVELSSVTLMLTAICH